MGKAVRAPTEQCVTRLVHLPHSVTTIILPVEGNVVGGSRV